MFDFLFYVFLIIFFEVSAQYLYKLSYLKLYKDKKNIFLIIGLIFYTIVGFLAYKLLSYGDLGIVNLIWHLMHFIILFLIGFYLLNEKLTYKKLIGLIFAFIALYLFMSENDHHH
jgi:drug/metabolite transporter (DMT)-like permease